MNNHDKKFNKNRLRGIFVCFAFIFVFSISIFSQSRTVSENPLIPVDFKGDGCSQFPDGDYADCCFEHDKAYFVGGNWKMRWRADKKLYKCVAAKKGVEHKFIAPVMWLGVRVFGVPWLPTRFRWGFGRKQISK